MGRRRPRALAQGELDGLCGVYSIINAVALALHNLARDPSSFGFSRDLSEAEKSDLFTALVTRVVYRRNAVRPLIDGISTPDFLHLINRAAVWLGDRRHLKMTLERPFHARVRVPTQELTTILKAHLRRAGTAAIIGLEPPWEHWTVVASVTRSRLILLDSDGNADLPLRSCGRSCDRHAGLLRPAHVFLLTVRTLVKSRKIGTNSRPA